MDAGHDADAVSTADALHSGHESCEHYICPCGEPMSPTIRMEADVWYQQEDVLARIAAVLQQRRAMGLPLNGPGGIGMINEDGEEVQTGEDCVVS